MVLKKYRNIKKVVIYKNWTKITKAAPLGRGEEVCMEEGVWAWGISLELIFFDRSLMSNHILL